MTELPAVPIAEPIVVTGATGFIGQRLVRRLLDEGHRVVAFVLPNDATDPSWNEDSGVEVRRGDITMRHTVRQALRDAKTVFHLAAVVGDWGTEELHRRVTVNGTKTVLEECARVGARAVLTSSVVVYGHRIGREICDETRPFGAPMGPYSRSKQQQELVARDIEARTGLKLTIVRPCNVYGPASPPWVDMLVETLKRRDPSLVGRGDGCAGLTYVDNVVDVLVRVAQRPGSIGRVYNANDDHGVTWSRYFHDIAELCGAAKPKSVPRVLALAGAHVLETSFRLLRRAKRPPITREALNLVGSNHRVPIERACRELGYQVPVGYQAGMDAVGAYLRANG